MDNAPHQFLIALGSNRRHHRFGPPEAVLSSAIAALDASGIAILAVAPVIRSAPIGPSRRRYANGAVLAETTLAPLDLLALLKGIEADFGTRRGQRWASRTLDLDIVLWSGGAWHSRNPALIIPHIAFRERSFVLQPARCIVPHWRDPITGLTIRQLAARNA